MPGKNDLVDGYTSCPALMQVVAQCVEDVIDPNPDLPSIFPPANPRLGYVVFGGITCQKRG